LILLTERRANIRTSWFGGRKNGAKAAALSRSSDSWARKMNPKPSKKRVAIFMALLAVGALGISYAHYRSMAQPIPDFKSLKQICADGMKYEIARPRGISDQVGFEFFDQNGNRYQTDYMGPEQAKAIEDALQRRGVVLSVGRWKSALASDSIFSVYHMTRGNEVLIDYKRSVEDKVVEQQNALPVIVCTLVLFVGIVVYVLLKQRKRQLDLSIDANMHD
jgi:hypothetical protein